MLIKKNILLLPYSLFKLLLKEFLFFLTIDGLHFLMQSYLKVFEVLKVNKC